MDFNQILKNEVPPNRREQEENYIDLYSLLLPLFRSIAAFWKNRIPFLVVGGTVGVAAGFGMAHILRPNAYQAIALFEMMASPIKNIMEPLSNQAEQTLGSRTLENNDPLAEKNKSKEQQQQKELKTREERLATITTYKTILMSPQIKQMTRQKLARMGFKEMGGLADIRHIEPTNLLEIQATHPDPEIAYQTANAWAITVIDYLTNLNAEQFQVGKSYFWTQYQKSKNEISRIETKLIALKKEAQFELRETELAAKKEMLLRNIKELEALKANIQSDEASLPTLIQLTKNEEQGSAALRAFQIGKGKSNIETKLLKKLAKNPERIDQIIKNLSTLQTVPSLISPRYVQLEKQTKETAARLATQKPTQFLIEKSIGRLEKEATTLQTSLNEQKIIQTSLEKDLEIVRRQNELIFSKVSEAELASAMRFADLKLVSYSSVPDSKLPPPIKKFAKAGALLGALLGYLASRLMSKPISRINANGQNKPNFTRHQKSEEGAALSSV